MGYHLENNNMLKSTISRLMFHWCGPAADVGIRQLHQMEQLEAIIVEVSKTTSKHLTQREQWIRRYFGTKRGAHNTLPESLGWDELLEIRGLQRVRVEHVNKRKADRRTDDERTSLENVLQATLLQPANND
jgi:hypothetical protein